MRLELHRRDFLRGLLTTGALLAAPARASSGGRCFVVVVANGGWDPTYCFEPKLSSAFVEGPEFHAPVWGPLDGPDDVNTVQTFAGIPIVVNPVKRPSVIEFFETWSDRTAVVNGIATGVISHYSSRLRMLTGTVLSTSPDLSVITGRTLGYDMPLAQVDLANLSFTGPYAASSGTLGSRSQIKALLQPEFPPQAPDGVAPYPRFLPDDTDEDAVRAFLRTRADRYRETRGVTDASAAKLADFDEALVRAERLRGQTSGLLGHLEVGIEADYPQMIDVAIELLANEVSRTVLLDTQAPWDSHSANVIQNSCFEDTFAGLLTLASGLRAAGLLERTTILVVSEMGRTPKHNVVYGKDHWPYTSAMVFGAGVRPGVYGATDDELVARGIDLASGQPVDGAPPLRYDHFAAGILEMLGVDPEEHLPGVPPLRGFLGVIGGFLLACGHDPPPPPAPACTDLEWTTWAKPLLQTWCTPCHHSALEGEGRRGAPVGVDFDLYDVVVAYADEIRQAAIVDQRMPPAGGPSDEERALLDEWLGCGLPGGTTPIPDPCDAPRRVPAGDLVCGEGGLAVDGSMDVDGDVPCLCEVTGDLTVVGPSSLAALRTVGGTLRVTADTRVDALTATGPLRVEGGDLHAPSLVDVASVDVSGVTVARLELSGIRTVAGDVRIAGNPGLVEVDVARMTDVDGGFFVVGNPALEGLTNDDTLDTVAGDVALSQNPKLAVIGGFRRLHAVGGGVVISENAALTAVSGFLELETLPADLRIVDNPSLASITGFVILADIGGGLSVEHQQALTTIGPFTRLVAVGGEVRWVDDGVAVHDGFPVLASVGGLRVLDDGVLTRLRLPALATAGVVEVARVPSLVELGLPALAAADQLTFTGPLGLGLVSTVGVTELPGGLSLMDTATVGVLRAPVLRTSGTIRITGNQGLTGLDLDEVEAVDGDFVVRGNPGLSGATVEAVVAGIEVSGVVDVGDNGP